LQWAQELGAEATTVSGLLEEDHEEVREYISIGFTTG
jgi:hypothetical protein